MLTGAVNIEVMHDGIQAGASFYMVMPHAGSSKNCLRKNI